MTTVPATFPSTVQAAQRAKDLPAYAALESLPSSLQAKYEAVDGSKKPAEFKSSFPLVDLLTNYLLPSNLLPDPPNDQSHKNTQNNPTDYLEWGVTEHFF